MGGLMGRIFAASALFVAALAASAIGQSTDPDLPALQRQVEDARVRHGQHSLELAKALRTAAQSLLQQSAHDKALPLLKESLEIYAKQRVPVLPDHGEVLTNLGVCHLLDTKPREAIPFFEQADALYPKRDQDYRRHRATANSGLASCYLMLKEPDLFRKYAEQSLSLIETSDPPQEGEIAMRRTLAESHLDGGRLKEAAEMLEEALGRSVELSEASESRADVLTAFSSLFRKQQREADAKVCEDLAAAIRDFARKGAAADRTDREQLRNSEQGAARHWLKSVVKPDGEDALDSRALAQLYHSSSDAGFVLLAATLRDEVAVSRLAFMILRAMDGRATAACIQGLIDDNPFIRFTARRLLMIQGLSAFPALSDAVAKPDARLGGAALLVQQAISRDALPKIVEVAQENQDMKVKVVAVRVLGNFGRFAKDARPLLTSLQKHSDARLSETAKGSLAQIDQDLARAEQSAPAAPHSDEAFRRSEAAVREQTARAFRAATVELVREHSYSMATEAAGLAQQVLEELHGRNHPSTLAAQADKAAALAQGGELESAEKEVLSLLQATDENPAIALEADELANPFTALAIAYMQTGRGETAELLLLRVLAIRESSRRVDPGQLAAALGNLAAFYRDAELPEKGAMYVERALTVADANPDDVPSGLLVALLNQQGMQQLDAGKYPEAMEILKHAEEACRKSPELRQGHPQFGIVLDNIGLVLHKSGQLKDARPYFQAALRIFRAQSTPDDMAICLLNLGDLEKDERQYKKSIAYYREAVAIREKSLGSSHPRMLGALRRLADAYELSGSTIEATQARKQIDETLGVSRQKHQAMIQQLEELLRQSSKARDEGDFMLALQQLDKAVGMAEKEMGLHPALLEILCELADRYIELEKFERARVVLERCRKLLELTTGEQRVEQEIEFHQTMGNLMYAMKRFQDARAHVDMAWRLSDSGQKEPTRVKAALRSILGVLDMRTGDFAAAQQHFDAALEIQRSQKDEDPVNYALALVNRGSLYKHQGDVKQAIAAFEESLEILEKTLGDGHPTTLSAQGNLGVLYYELGNYEQALKIYERAVDISKRSLGETHLVTVTRMSDLGENLKFLGRFDEASKWLEQAVKISLRERPNHIESAIVLSNLAQLRQIQNKRPEAIAFYERALEICLKQNQGRNEITPEIYWQLAHIREWEGDDREARDLYQKAYKLQQQVFGPSSHRTARCRCDMSQVLFRLGERGLALEHWQQGWEVLNQYRRDAFCFSSSNEQLLLHKTFQDHLNRIAAMAEEARDPAWDAVAASAILSSKGLTVEALARRRAALVRQEGDIGPLLRELELAQASLFQFSMNPPRNALGKADDTAVKAMRHRVQQAEAKLARFSSPLIELRNSSEATVNQVAERLPVGSALVEYVKYQRDDGDKYAALVLSRQPGTAVPHIAFVPLADAGVVDRAVARWRKAVAPEAARNGQPVGDTEELSVSGAELARLVWRPLETHLAGKSIVFLAADGSLAFVSFAALPDAAAKSFLIESFELVYLTTGRELIASPIERAVGAPVIVGEPRYELQPAAQGQPSQLNSTTGWPPLAALKFEPTPGAQQEADRIEKLLIANRLAPQRLKGEGATESAVRDLPRPRLIHFSSHGFFLPTPESPRGRSDVKSVVRGVGVVRPLSGSPSTIPRFDASVFSAQQVDPMLRSGIALAGINDTVAGRRATGGDDGILTAQEISALNLQGTELVVISTCDSGLGEVLDGEGVFGMRRAFAVAGAKSLIFSLWPVADVPTRDFMVSLYSEYCDGAPSYKALRSAQLKAIAAKRSVGEFPHPFYWAAFVLSGCIEPASQQ